MDWVVCIVPVCPMRKEAAHRSEMVSQLLFGDIAEILEDTRDFIRVRYLYDGYEGWCQKTQLTGINISALELYNKQLAAGWANTIDLNGQPMQIALGSSLALLPSGKAQLGKYAVHYSGKSWDPLVQEFSSDAIKQLSLLFLNTGYLWGGRSVFGIDCSGFVQQVFRFFNKWLPRDAWQQAEQGNVVGFLQEVQCGDLAFFDNAEGRITHVGLLWDGETIIHASGKVRIDKIDNQGILNSDTGERTHTLRIIKRYI